MSMTITEKILANHAGLDEVVPGQLITAKLDLVLANDVTAPVAIKEFEKFGSDNVFDTYKVALVLDHFAPNKDIASAEQCKFIKEFALKQDIEHFYQAGRMGIEHCLLPELGITLPGDCIIGADSHTCTYGALGAFATGVGSTDLAAGLATGEAWFRVPESVEFIFKGTKFQPWVSGKDLILYVIGKIGVDGARYQAMEFTGEGISALSMDNRFTICNMAIEAGAKNGIIAPDEKTYKYLKGRARRSYTSFFSDEDAKYANVMEFDVADIPLQVAFPHLPENTKDVEAASGVKIDQVVIGSCTNGRIEDLRIAAEILREKQVHPEIRLLVFPGTQAIYRQALKEGIIDTMVEAGAAVSTPTCGPCLGGHMGILAKGEKALATTNRNFVGRMGHPESEVYLCNPAVAAASAIRGEIVHPKEVL
ncbi:MAG: 3-isopropylmalate dehydratase large subunit [Desulfitobacteriaceae bacterium]|nr:3-isopropylmalate dehydratase large subunit [Desulfitobacteriaceae bacterium]MDD4345696.1 3-isopropylmalate dehydratase large subunit [Desulfitobacteriaceae bacterium]MDD4401346.1 3-isopropylmalate dehydratase large subunit [Desulfitobacteriaceae bacterium]